jgi:hypothetical protein
MIRVSAENLARLLAAGLPSAEETLLLRACLHEGEAGRRAWDAARSVWEPAICSPSGDTLADREAVKLLWPLLAGALRRNGMTPTPGVQSALQALSLREEVRSRVYRQICGQALDIVSGHGLSAIVLNGAALAETAYPDPAMRHCHDIDLLVPRSQLLPAATALVAQGSWHRTGSSAGDDVQLTHDSGLALELHTRLVPTRYHPMSRHAVRKRSRAATIAGCPVPVLSPADGLLHLCGLWSSRPGSRSLRRLCDGWFIVDRNPDLDWDLVVRNGIRARLAVTLFVTLGYLRTELAAPIPVATLEQLAVAAARSGVTERQLALRRARLGSRGGIRALLRMSPDLKARGLLLRWMLWPSPDYLRVVSGTRGALPMTYWYLRRPLYLGARLIQVVPQLLQRRRNETARA